MEVLQQDITGGYWNKPSYLISLLVRELAKSPEERVQWLMYVELLWKPSLMKIRQLPALNNPRPLGRILPRRISLNLPMTGRRLISLNQ